MTPSFRGDRFFLSNFYPTPVAIEGIVYPSAEHAYQAMKTSDPFTRQTIALLQTPAQAKRYGRSLPLPPLWYARKDDCMRTVLEAKFRNADLAAKLLATDDEPLVETNTCGDTYWGTYNGTGLNRLGEMLMDLRERLRSTAGVQP